MSVKANVLIRGLKRAPGFRSGKWWKAVIASSFYFFLLFVCLATIIPSAPSLALEKVKPTNKSSVSIKGKTHSGKPVYLLQNNKIIQSIRADSEGKFFFGLNNLEEGNFTYTVKACNSDKKNKCKSENILVAIDRTPPAKPVITLPNKLPDDSGGQIVIKGTSEPDVKIIALVQDKKLPLITTNDKGEFEIKTGLVLGANTINIKAIDNAGNESKISSASINFNPKKYKVKVLRVIDGDTIKIEGNKIVRYIGIDAPETVHPNKSVQCYGKEASSKNRELVEGREVELEKDVSEVDKYGRLLRYVWIGNMLVNEYLVREGYARSSAYPPDIKYQNRFLEAQRKAREEKKGLWGDICSISQQVQVSSQYPSQVTTSTNAPPPQVQPIRQTQPDTGTLGSYVCDCSKTCSQMSSCAEAQYQLNVCGCSRRDGDKDGIACDADCQ